MMVERCGSHELEQRGCIAGQMLAAHGPAGGRAAVGSSIDLAERAHVLDRHDDLDLERLADAGVDDRDRARPAAAARAKPPRKRAISSSGRCVADSPMRCGGRSQSAFEPLEA